MNNAEDIKSPTPPALASGSGSNAISRTELENMGKATLMTNKQLVEHLRVIASIYRDEDLAKWIIGVAAERIEKHLNEKLSEPARENL